jgi:cytochrome c biogenesis protein CcdA
VVGRGAPFLLLRLFVGRVGLWLAWIDRARRIAEVVSGIALLALAIYFGRMAVTLL